MFSRCHFSGQELRILEYGSRLEKSQSAVESRVESSTINLDTSLPSQLRTAVTQIGSTLHKNTRSALSILLLQIIVIVIAARLFGRLFRKVGQPAVIGEMVAGILLGPSLLGMLSPSTLSFLLKWAAKDERPFAVPVTIVLAFVFACAWFTESIGIHALFGGFLAGAVMPSAPGFRSSLKEKLETLTSSLLLPLFFAFTGLRTQIGHLNDWESWLLGTTIIAVAIAGKLGGSTLAARWTGMGWSESFSIGALMNTRGLVELVVLNIGYDLGILPDRIFSIMVLMALVTTGMTSPLLFLIAKLESRKKAYPPWG